MHAWLIQVVTFSLKSRAPLIIIVSSCVSSPPLPAYVGEKQHVKWKLEIKLLSIIKSSQIRHGSQNIIMCVFFLLYHKPETTSWL